jgi:hypothetical protein
LWGRKSRLRGAAAFKSARLAHSWPGNALLTGLLVRVVEVAT